MQSKQGLDSFNLLGSLFTIESKSSFSVANVCSNDYNHHKTRNVYPYALFNKKLYIQHTTHPTYNVQHNNYTNKRYIEYMLRYSIRVLGLGKGVRIEINCKVVK